MRNKSILLVAALIFLVSGCHHYKNAGSPKHFQTSFGDIQEGASMAEVLSVLGNPHEVSHYQRREIWQYDFQQGGKLSVYFVKGVVAKVYAY